MLDLAVAGFGPQFASLQALITGGQDALATARILLAQAQAGGHLAALLPAETPLLAPIPRPLKNVFCVGRNYVDHIAEGARAQNRRVEVTEVPVFFTKPPTAMIGTAADIPYWPHLSNSTDYEVELAVIIGKPGLNIRCKDAMDHVFGYTILNDITARDLQRRHGGQWLKGKSLDGTCPMGPWIVTADSLEHRNLRITCRVNGVTKQDSNTKFLYFKLPRIIAELSLGTTLEPGDVISTGTPEGVGFARTPPEFMKPGDLMETEIEGIGILRNVIGT